MAPPVKLSFLERPQLARSRDPVTNAPLGVGDPDLVATNDDLPQALGMAKAADAEQRARIAARGTTTHTVGESAFPDSGPGMQGQSFEDLLHMMVDTDKLDDAWNAAPPAVPAPAAAPVAPRAGPPVARPFIPMPRKR